MPGPFAILAKLPVVRRLWWPDRAMVLAAGGAVRLLEHLPARWPRPLLAAACGATLLVEAFLGLSNLPLPVTSGVPSKGALALAQGHGPLLVLPGMSGLIHRDPQMLLDQVWHGRPLVNGPMPPDSATAPRAYREVSRLPVMAALYGCGQGMTPRSELSPELVLDRLNSMGVTEVAVDTAATGFASDQGATYLRCIETLLGQTYTQRPPYRVYATARSAQ
ncbi:MAG: hypothetical protein GXP62_19635 [Oligoflexia bacterium]|nr:hypothetical protein [Oligoflexia bacterium]